MAVAEHAAASRDHRNSVDLKILLLRSDVFLMVP